MFKKFQGKIDSHAHIMPKNWPDLKEKYGYEGFIKPVYNSEKDTVSLFKDDGTFFREVLPNCYDPNAILPEMDAFGVEKMVLCTIPVLFNYWAKAEHTLDWSIFLNDHIVEIQNHPSGRFVGLGTVPMQHTGFAIQEMERAKKIGLAGLQIGSNINNMNLDDESLFPFWEAAESLNVPIFVHPWQMLGEEKIKKFWLPWLVGMPAETSRAICSMLFGGVFDKFPKLKVMFAHAGGAFPFTIGRVSHGWHCRPDLVNINQVEDPYTYAGKFWVDGITHDQDALRFLIKKIGEDKICYGTDYPFPLGDLEHGRFIEEMTDLGEETRNKLFRNNIMDFLNLSKGI
jgi:aminocarboxymuconate-semialdehyde decarboxylase